MKAPYINNIRCFHFMEHRVMPIGKMKNPIVMNPMSMIMPIMISILLLVISIFVKFECFLCDFVI